MESTRRRRPIARAFTVRAFTLIELLVVIAIIAILTAILLPVFASVREGARQSTSISNMKDIQQKMAQFKLDNHRYPDVLFGYYVPGTATTPSTMKSALGLAQNTGQAALYFPGLYPAYIKDPEEFTDPNNTVNTSDASKLTSGLAVNLVAPCNQNNDNTLSSPTTTPASTSVCGTAAYGAGSVVPTTRYFYLADAYDSSPQVAGTNQITNPSVSLLRYGIAREGTACNNAMPIGCDPAVQTSVKNPDGTVANYQPYTHQLRWQNPPSDTVITATTYHVQNADKVLLMFESGTVKKITGNDFAANEGAAKFWQITP